ncbi:hypothetical protein J6590_058518 [Homalodisca vitripennis]|nr:hypothetical protein J6590_058518 [Homalodisca vitripennis]
MVKRAELTVINEGSISTFRRPRGAVGETPLAMSDKGDLGGWQPFHTAVWL